MPVTSNGFVVVDHKVFGGGLNHVQIFAKSILDQEGISGSENLNFAVLGFESNVARDDVVELVTVRVGVSGVWCTGPDASDHLIRTLHKEGGGLVVWVTVDHAIPQVAQTALLAHPRALLEINDGLVHGAVDLARGVVAVAAEEQQPIAYRMSDFLVSQPIPFVQKKLAKAAEWSEGLRSDHVEDIGELQG